MTGRPPRIAAEQLDFTRLLRPGDTVTWSQGAAEPSTLIERLLEQRPAIGPLTVFLGASYASTLRPDNVEGLRLLGMNGGGSNRALSDAGKMDFIPCHLSDVPRMLRSGAIRIDVVLTQLSWSERRGAYSFGAVNGYVQAAMKTARVVIAEINDRAPWTASRSPVPIEQIHLLVPVSRALVEVPARKPNSNDEKVANQAARYIEDGSILQVGIGGVPGAIYSAVRDRRDLGIHSGILGDECLELLRSGAVTNATKPRGERQSVTAVLAGTRALYDFAHENDELRVEPVDLTHDLVSLASLPKLVTVNSAVEVDLTGQVNAEIGGRRYVGGVGGQTDFVRAAFASPGGRSIIALSSRAGRDGPSRIVSRLESGVVTTARADADIVVTEHGAAELRGCAIPERVRRMIAIADPAFREALEQEARSTALGF